MSGLRASGEELTVSAEAFGSSSPPVLTQSSQQNGDFIITDSPGPCSVTVGDGEDELTTWSLDLTEDPGFAAFDASPGVLSAAVLTLTLTPPETPCAPGPPWGITTDVFRITGLPDIVTTTIQSLPVEVTSTVQVSLLGDGERYTEEQILGAIQAGNGIVPFQYSDDAVVSYARLELIKSPGVPTLGALGRACLTTILAAVGMLAIRRGHGRV
jgi:hypothetical protein